MYWASAPGRGRSRASDSCSVKVWKGCCSTPQSSYTWPIFVHQHSNTCTPYCLHGAYRNGCLIHSLFFLKKSAQNRTEPLIALGILSSWIYGVKASKKFGVSRDTITDMFVWIMVSAFIGGKVLFYFENPSYYFSSWENMTKNIGNGFVFYGSMLFVIPTLWWFFRRKKIPAFKMLDVIAIGGAITHAFGRMGCFMAGCCHGVETDSFLGVVFSDPLCRAHPKGVPLHPTQLYSVFMLLIILVVLFIVKRRKKFDGQLFPIYLMMYAVGRAIIEMYRGDEARGYLFNGALSHSQFISIFIFAGAIWLYRYLQRKGANTAAATSGQASEN